MSLPVLAKTWQFQVNQTVAQQASLAATMKLANRTLKNLFKGFVTNPWTVVGSSNGTSSNLTGTDLWATDADIVQNSSGSAHSWIVLKQTGVSTNFQMCIDLNSTNTYQFSLVISENAGFTGGSTTARPTATDETVIMNASSFWNSVNVQHQLNAMQSTDGQCTRIIGCQSGVTGTSFLIIDKAQNPVTGWTRPWFAYGNGGAANVATYSNLCNATLNLRGRGNGNFSISMTCESFNTTMFPQLTDIGSVANSFSNEWPFFPIGLASTTLNNKGRHGTVFDLWWRPTTINPADSFPNNASTRQFMAIGDLIFPWVGDATTLVTT